MRAPRGIGQLQAPPDQLFRDWNNFSPSNNPPSPLSDWGLKAVWPIPATEPKVNSQARQGPKKCRPPPLHNLTIGRKSAYLLAKRVFPLPRHQHRHSSLPPPSSVACLNLASLPHRDLQLHSALPRTCPRPPLFSRWRICRFPERGIMAHGQTWGNQAR
jgi:hypothetical protein